MVHIHSGTGRGGEKMALELKPDQLNRLDDLLSNEWRGKRPYLARPDKVKIKAEQVIEVKRLLEAGMSLVAIQNETSLSEYHIRGVRRRTYDFLVLTKEQVIIVKLLLNTNKTTRTISSETGISELQIHDVMNGVYNILLE